MCRNGGDLILGFDHTSSLRCETGASTVFLLPHKIKNALHHIGRHPHARPSTKCDGARCDRTPVMPGFMALAVIT